MVSFNIIADCVSRDICNPLIEKGTAQVLQYTAFSNPFSAVAKKGLEINYDDLTNYACHNFEKRSMCHDINKTVFEYAFQKKSDYLIINMDNSTRALLINDKGHIITNNCMVRKNRERLNADYGMDDYVELPLNSITDSMWDEALSKFAERILEYYTPDQIILHKFFAVPKFISKSGTINEFANKKFIKFANEIVNKTNEIIESKLYNPHVIDFPDFVLSDSSHKFGLIPHHYFNDYYLYGGKALEIIMQKLPAKQEKQMLEDLKNESSSKFELILHDYYYKEYKNKYNQLRIIKTISENKNKYSSEKISDSIKSITDMELYIEALEALKHDYLIVLAIRDTVGKYFPNIMKKIKEFGFTKCSDDFRKTYVGVMSKGQILCDIAGDEMEDVKYTNEELKLHSLSSSFSMHNKAQIIIDGIDYAVNIRSYNLVVYDIENHVLIDSLGYDNFWPDGKFVRKSI
ncbi:MAG: hypothetical protein K2O34_00630 [Acetatifactor sp.]|nr:hypothetical protein [Acetatifactor sp.]